MLFLDELKEKVENCRKCGLWMRRQNVVIHRGSEIPAIVFVGEAPGIEEDKQGKPFVGKAGSLLQAWINELNLSSDDYAIMNVIKCIPKIDGGVRPPTRYEMEACREWTEAQLFFYSPKIIVALGVIASIFLLERDDIRMQDVENRLYQTRFGKVFCFPHPAYFLRRNEKADLRQLKLVLKTYI